MPQDQMQDAYMIPSRVFVGDRATFILPLPGFSGQDDPAPSWIPSPDIDIHRVALEGRPGGSFLTIEFSAFTTGVLELPSIDIAGDVFSGLTIEVSSVLQSGETGTVLSGPAGPLAVPGTSLLVYGTIGASIAALSLTLWALLWGRRQVSGWIAAWRRWRLMAAMWGIEKRLRKALAKGVARREILDTLAKEFRTFLSYYSGVNCRPKTAPEFGDEIFREYPTLPPDSESLEGFFGRCDRMRFRGGEIYIGETQALLTDLRYFLSALGKAKRVAA